MRRSRTGGLALLAFAPFALVACGGADTEEMADDAMEEAPPPAAEAPPATDAASSTMVQVMPLNESGASGEVEIRASGEGTELRVVLRGAGEGVHQGHIHTGTCDAPGGVVAPLEAITADTEGTGEATTTVDVPMMTVMNGSHIVLYHQAGGEPGAPIACAAIPGHTM